MLKSPALAPGKDLVGISSGTGVVTLLEINSIIS
jgi:hypothetical protein